MSREFKFRLYFYDKELKRIQYSTHKFEITDKRLYIMLANFEENIIKGFCQYTGLRDKNDVEIYQDDLVELYWPYTGSSYFCKVFWLQERACWAMVERGHGNYDGIFHYFGSQDTKLMDVEVLGNCYQNTELH